MATKPDSPATPTPTPDPSASRDSGASRQRNVRQRKSQFLVAPRRHGAMQMMGLAPLNFSVVEQALRDAPDIEVIDKIAPRQAVGALGAGLQEGGVLVTLMNDEKASALAMQAQGQLIVERDQSLQLLDANYAQPPMVTCNLPFSGTAFTAEFLVTGEGGKPVAGAEVYLFGSLLPAQGVSDASGRVKLVLYGESGTSLRQLYVKPRADYWSYCQQQPDVSDSEINMITLRPLSEWPTLKNFPRQQQLTWGQRAMRADQLPPTYRGQGVRVAVIDSGCATTHADLSQVSHGYDIVNKAKDTSTWTVDTISHGSHCTGVIAGLDSATGIRGFAPDAEIHACKLFPGGQISQLIDALEYCIEKQIDIVNLSLGGAEPSEALEQQILRARQAGIACIVAAGNSGGAVQYPGSSPNVLTVAAIGRINEFPGDSYHTQTLTPQIDVNGFFAARFSCHGPEIDVCAPGVAITSSVPDNNFAAWDGTSMAAPHVTGLAALVLAHHPDFRSALRSRSAERVERLFQLIKMSCQPVMLGDPRRTGFGLPDVPRAVGLAPAAGMSVGQQAMVGIGTGAGTGMGANIGMGTGAGGIGSLIGSALGAMPGSGAGTGMGMMSMGTGMSSGMGQSLGSLISGPALQALGQAYRELPTQMAQVSAQGTGMGPGMSMGMGPLDPFAPLLSPQMQMALNPALRFGYW
ncbi:MAG: hypothetical protein RL404_2720 [Pseudomonadota bacterium]